MRLLPAALLATLALTAATGAQKADGAGVIRSAGEVQVGETINTRLASGRLTSRVESIIEGS